MQIQIHFWLPTRNIMLSNVIQRSVALPHCRRINRYLRLRQGKQVFKLRLRLAVGVIQNLGFARAGEDLFFSFVLHGFEYRLIHGQKVERAGLDVVHLDIFQIDTEDFYGWQADEDFSVHDIDVVGVKLVQIQARQHLAAHDKQTALRVLPQSAPVAFFLGSDDGVDVKSRAFQAVHLLNLHQNAFARNRFMGIVVAVLGIKPAARRCERAKNRY